MYDDLWDNNPMVQKMREQDKATGRQEGRQEGLQQGRQEGLQEGLQRSLVHTIRIRFPDLAEFAQYQASHFDKPDVLESLIEQVVVAPHATAVLKLQRSEAKM